MNIFRLKYDYPQYEGFDKGGGARNDSNELLSDAGTIPASKIIGAFCEKDYSQLDSNMRTALLEASDMLARTCDPQLSDLLWTGL